MNASNSLKQKENTGESRGNTLLKAALAGLLIATPIAVNSIEANDVSAHHRQYDQDATVSKDTFVVATENNEAAEVTDSVLFVRAVAKALKPLKKLTDMPDKGIPLIYESTPKKDLPKTMNIYPKVMKVDHLPYTLIQLGEKLFQIIPKAGLLVDTIYIDKDDFSVQVSETTMLGDIFHRTASKNKNNEMGEYLYRLYKNGATGSYKGSSVNEIPKAYQAKVLDYYEKKVNVVTQE